MSQTSNAILDALKRAAAQRDAKLHISLYAADAEVTLVDKNDTPSKPRVIKGKAAIAEFLNDVYSRDMTHKIESGVAGEDKIADLTHCAYPDGCNVLYSAMVEVKNGKIVREVGVQAWDE